MNVAWLGLSSRQAPELFQWPGDPPLAEKRKLPRQPHGSVAVSTERPLQREDVERSLHVHRNQETIESRRELNQFRSYPSHLAPVAASLATPPLPLWASIQISQVF